MDNLEERARSFFRDFIIAMSSRNEKSLDHVMSFIDEDFKGFGTGKGEVFKCKDDIRIQMQNEIEQLPKGYEWNEIWLDSTLHGKTVDIVTTLTTKAEFNQKVISLDGRATCVIKEKNGELKVTQLHVSEADVASEVIPGAVMPGTLEPQLYDEVTVLFTDFVGFTEIASAISAKKLVGELNELFAKFDEVAEKNGLLKIKTIGDAYMAVAGLRSEKNHAEICVASAKEIIDFLNERNAGNELKWNIRIGIHSGPVVGGTIGSKNLTFDIWGHTVNVASRLEAAGMINRISVSGDVYECIKDKYECESNREVEVKGKGKIDVYVVK